MSSSSTRALAQLQAQYGSANWSQYVPQDWCYYDYVGYPTTTGAAGGASNLTFFTNPRGVIDPVTGLQKTDEQTNIEKAGAIGNVYFILTKIRTDIMLAPYARQTAGINGSNSFDADQFLYSNWVAAMAAQGVFTLTVQQKEYMVVQNPFMAMPPGFGMDSVLPPWKGAGTSNTQLNGFTQLSPDDSDAFDNYPILMMAPDTTFSANISFPQQNAPAIDALFLNTGGTNTSPVIYIGLILEGIMVRPTQ
jgi:hypothetical protein